MGLHRRIAGVVPDQPDRFRLTRCSQDLSTASSPTDKRNLSYNGPSCERKAGNSIHPRDTPVSSVVRSKTEAETHAAHLSFEPPIRSAGRYQSPIETILGPEGKVSSGPVPAESRTFAPVGALGGESPERRQSSALPTQSSIAECACWDTSQEFRSTSGFLRIRTYPLGRSIGNSSLRRCCVARTRSRR